MLSPAAGDAAESHVAEDSGSDLTEVESSLDKFEEMAEKITTEEVYEQALAGDFEWQMDGTGNLTPDPEDEDSPAQTEPGELKDAAPGVVAADGDAAETESGDDWGNLDAANEDVETSEDEEERIPRAAPDLF